MSLVVTLAAAPPDRHPVRVRRHGLVVVEHPRRDLVALVERRHTRPVNDNWRRWAGAAGTATIIGMITLTMFSIAFKKGTDWWAAWGQWVGGIGGIAAAAAAVWIAIMGWQKSDAQDRQKAERDLASKFGAWIDRENLLEPSVMVANSGPLPIYEVQLAFDFPYPGALTDTWDEGSPARRKSVIGIGTVGPLPAPYMHRHATEYLKRHITDLAEEHLGIEAFNKEHFPLFRFLSDAGENDLRNIVPFGWLEVHFSDSNGARWTRTHEGRLKRFSGWS
jgi:hypothetical protein